MDRSRPTCAYRRLDRLSCSCPLRSGAQLRADLLTLASRSLGCGVIAQRGRRMPPLRQPLRTSVKSVLWRRYRSIVLGSLPVAAAIGALLGLSLYFVGESEYRQLGGWGAFVYWVALGALLGVLTALPGILGAAGALALTDRSLTRTPSARARMGAVGAAAGALLVWFGIGVADAVLNSAGAWLGLSLALGGVAAIISAAAAAVLITITEARIARRS
jgi:hypothetical protein